MSSSGRKETVLLSHNEMEIALIDDAKLTEQENWKRNHVYKEVPYSGQKCIFVKWVFTKVYADGKNLIKSRLVARGFEKVDLLQVDSPSCSKESLRLASSIMESKG